jgi:hypothetical protein
VADPGGLIRVALVLGKVQLVQHLLQAVLVGLGQVRVGQRGVRAGQPLHGVFEQPGHARVDQVHEVVQGAAAHFVPCQPERFLRSGAAGDLEAVAGDFGPDMRLGPVQPVAAEFQVPAQPVVGPQAAADAVPGFQDDHLVAAAGELAGCDEAGDTGTDNDDVGVFSH